MKLSIINNWIKGGITSREMTSILDPYLETHLEKLTTKGISSPIFLTEDIQMSFEYSDFSFLCTSFLDSNINELELSYISELLLLAPSVSIKEEKVLEGLEYLCDLDIYGKFTKADVMNLL